MATLCCGKAQLAPLHPSSPPILPDAPAATALPNPHPHLSCRCAPSGPRTLWAPHPLGHTPSRGPAPSAMATASHTDLTEGILNSAPWVSYSGTSTAWRGSRPPQGRAVGVPDSTTSHPLALRADPFCPLSVFTANAQDPHLSSTHRPHETLEAPLSAPNSPNAASLASASHSHINSPPSSLSPPKAPLPSQAADKLGQKFISLRFCGSVSLGEPQGVHGAVLLLRVQGERMPWQSLKSPRDSCSWRPIPLPLAYHWAHLDGRGCSSHLKLRNPTCQALRVR